MEWSKTLGGTGVVLIIIGLLASPPFGLGDLGILRLIGMVLVLISMKGLSDVYGERGIFNNALYSFIFGTIETVMFMSTLRVLHLANIQAWIRMFWVITAIFEILIAIFYRKSFDLLAQKSAGETRFGERDMFEAAGLALLIAAILTAAGLILPIELGLVLLVDGTSPIFTFGFIMMLMAWMLVAGAFFLCKPSSLVH